MKSRLVASLLTIAILASLTALVTRAQKGAPPPQRPGALAGGVTLLPNGWRIAPAGKHVTVGDLPLNMVQSPDGRFLIVTNNGYSTPSLAVVDTSSWTVVSRMSIDDAWLGLAMHPDGQRMYSAARTEVHELAYRDGVLSPSRSFTLPAAPGSGFPGGLAVSPDGKKLFVVRVLAQTLVSIDVATGLVEKSVSLPAEPYTCVVSADGNVVYVSVWGAAKVLAFETATAQQVGEYAVGEHPSAMVATLKGDRLLVACANTNAVWAVDLATGKAAEQISTALYPAAPLSTTPNGLGLSRDGKTLLVANADNNTVAVVDIQNPGRSVVQGFIPTGWYPTGAMFSNDGTRVFVMSGKGLISRANPNGPSPLKADRGSEYIGGLLLGSLSVVPTPTRATLDSMTRQVYSLTPYSDKTRLAPESAPRVSPIPSKVGATSPIKHVFYVIRENRTYDQILGDVKAGNGDPTLCLFPENVTPNAHAISAEFVLFDNFYVDAEVSYDGHAFSTAAYATDIVEKMWPANYANRGGAYLSEGGGAMRNPYGNIAAPSKGYIWDYCRRAGVSVRSYGEFAELDRAVTGRKSFTARVPGLKGFTAEEYPPYDLEIPDATRVDAWEREFRHYEANGNLPALSILRLPNDHTRGTRPGALTPRAMIAENDAALGRLVSIITRSAYWKDSAIFVLEDDAQNGPDHVDAHRSVLLMASPFARRRAVDSSFYTTSGVLRTIELILGLEPMSQYDAAATPLYSAFQATPNPAAFEARPARIALNERNPPTGPGAKESMAMNLDEADRAPDLLLNEIIWHSVKGPDVPMPPPRRTAFVRPIDKE
jgi:DNA-binding beta-propeller fold protein YncE